MDAKGSALWLGLIALISATTSGAADLKSQIDGLAPSAYWPLENSFSTRTASGDEIAFLPFESGGAEATERGSGFYSPDYFPITPLHISEAVNSNAVWFGETTGDLAGAQRYLTLSSTQTGGQEPLARFKMDGKNDWTLHILAAPDPDPTNERGPEVLFFAGHAGTSVQVSIDAHATGTNIQVRREGQGFINGPQRSVPEANSAARHWYQIIVRYQQNPSNPVVKGIALDVAGQSQWQQSNQFLTIAQSTALHIGRGNDELSGFFNGAAHHVALWGRALSDVEVDALETARTIPPQSVPALTIDVAQPVRFFMWTVPTRDDFLSGNDRDGLNWHDSVWMTPGVYPMVRHQIDRPTSVGGAHTPPDEPAQTSLDAGATARQTFAWIKYVDDMLRAHTGKSLNDGIGYSLFWQNWGSPMRNFSGATGYYDDLGAARALMQNWRDAPYEWRNNTHASVPTVTERHEISNPFYREGMSQNAFRSVAIFKELNSLLEADPDLDKPARLHFDAEVKTNLEDIGEYLSAPVCAATDATAGWICGALDDPRSQLPEHWGVVSYWGRADASLNPCTAFAGTLDPQGLASPTHWLEQPRTLQNLLQVYHPTVGKWQMPNECFRDEYARFTRSQYAYALQMALERPARQELNSDIRTSEYFMAVAGDSRSTAFYSVGSEGPLLSRGPVGELDFSAPVLYPVTRDAIPAGDRGLTGWKSRLGLQYALFADSDNFAATNAPQAEVLEALDNFYVELNKHNVDIAVKVGAACAPVVQSPWLPYPGYTRADTSGVMPYTNSPQYTVKWQEVARLAVFAYRRGVREFLMFGGDSLVDGNQAGSATRLVGLENIFAAVQHASVSALDLTSTDALERSDPQFGVPDGIIDASDYEYYLARYAEADPEADIVAENGSCDLPDGRVSEFDRSTFIERIEGHLQ